MDRAQLGCDPTVVLAEESAIKDWKDYATSPTSPLDELRRPYVQEALIDQRLWPVYDVSVPSLDGPPRRFLIGKPRSGSQQPTGRSSRGYIAFDPEQRRIYFLKDAWRLDIASAQKTFDLNFFGPVRMVNAFVPLLRNAPTGHIVNISSGAGILPTPFITMYAAAKAALNQWGDSLRIELAPLGYGIALVRLCMLS